MVFCYRSQIRLREMVYRKRIDLYLATVLKSLFRSCFE